MAVTEIKEFYLNDNLEVVPEAESTVLRRIIFFDDREPLSSYSFRVTQEEEED